MKARCVEQDPLGWMEKGKIYDFVVNHNVYICGGFGVSKENFDRMFEKV